MADEKLLGDVVAEKMKKLHIDKVAESVSKVTKKPCGCNKRREQLNALHKRITGK